MIDRRIVKFLKKHHVLTIATSVDNKPWCASCFYVFLEKENALVFTSDLTTRHGREFLMNTLVAGTVALETMITGMIRGVQFEGTVAETGPDLEDITRNAYLKKFPVAMLMETHLWILRLTHIKYTDIWLGFGNKLIWKA